MIIGVLFWVLTVLCCGFAVWAGGAPGRWGAGLFIAAVVASTLTRKVYQHWAAPNVLLLLVDVGHFAALYGLAVWSRRYWPIWSAGFQLLAALTNVAAVLDATTVPRLYRALENFWSLPMLLTMAGGAWLDWRRRRRQQ